MMNLILVGLVVVLWSKYRKANKRYVELQKAHVSVVSEYAETIKRNVQIQQELLSSMRENRDLKRENKNLTDKYIDAVTLLEEHSVIFDNLKEDPMCLAKADKAYDDVCDMLLLDKELETSVFTTAVSANLCYDSINTNYYSHEDKEITISLFNDYNDEQHCFMYEYLNDKYGVSLDGSDIRTNTIFTVLHELGHYVDYSNKIEANEYDEYVEYIWNQKLALEGMEDGVESWKAYREIPSEAFADKFAIDFMRKHFAELI